MSINHFLGSITATAYTLPNNGPLQIRLHLFHKHQLYLKSEYVASIYKGNIREIKKRNENHLFIFFTI